MTLSTLMVQLDMDSPAENRLKAALDLAGRFEAELIAFAAADHRIHLPYEGGRAVAEAQRARKEEIASRLKELHQTFLDMAGDGAGTTWIGKFGHPTELLALHARSADMIVVGTPRQAEILERDRRIDVGKLVLAAGRPVLVLDGEETAPSAQTVIVAWKDAREARRAVADALPLLKAAKRVIVASVVENAEEPAREGCMAVVRHLMHHGVKAEESLLPPSRSPAADAVMELANEVGADLIVSGGYGHSRLREWAFGGVTRSLMHHGSVARLLSN